MSCENMQILQKRGHPRPLDTFLVFALSLHDLKTTDHTLKFLTVAKVKKNLTVAMETYGMIKQNCQFYSTTHLNRF